MELSNDKSNEATESKEKGTKKQIMTFNINDEGDVEADEEDEEAAPIQMYSEEKRKKHRFSSANKDQEHKKEIIPEPAKQKVEETPEEHNTDEKGENEEDQDYVVGQKPRGAIRKYKAWERKIDLQQEAQPEPNPEKEFSTIGERIRRGDYAQDTYLQKVQNNILADAKANAEIPLNQNIQSSQSEMVNRLENMKNQ